MGGRGDVFAPVGIDPLPSSPTQPPTFPPPLNIPFPLPFSRPLNNMRFVFLFYCIDENVFSVLL
jgi:hypothetical protein